MSFDYEKIKKNQDGGSHWTSYSDLFMVLSVVFLMLYVVANLRTGTHTLMQSIQNQNLKSELEIAVRAKQREERKVEDYLQNMAQREEIENYQRLMDKLVLLQEENQDEANLLRKKAMENEEKSLALNEYQKMIKEIIQANVLQKRKIKNKNLKVSEQFNKLKEQTRTIASKNETILEREKTIELKDERISQLDFEVEKKQQIIQKNEEVISEKLAIIKSNEKQIKDLNTEIKQKKNIIAANKKQMAKVQAGLEDKVKKLKWMRKKKKLNKALYNKKVKKLIAQAEAQKKALKMENKKVQAKLNQASDQVKKANSQLVDANNIIKNQQNQKLRLAQEINKIQSQLVQSEQELASSKQAYSAQIAELKNIKGKLEFQKQDLEQQREKLIAQRSQLKKDKDRLKSENNSLALQKSQLASQMNNLEIQKANLQIKKNQLEQQKNDLAAVNAQLEQVNNQLKDDKNQLTSSREKLQAEQERLKQERVKLEGDNQKLAQNLNDLNQNFENLSGELKSAQEIINAKKQLAKQIRENFAKAGIKAEINEGTGEVILAFGDNYFEDNQSSLKPQMKKILNKFLPIYTESVFKDPEVAKKIKSVDIIGFASPTYGGKYVNPNSLDPKDKKAIEYNTKLSAMRAQSVQSHIISSGVLDGKMRQKISPLLKISGKSYFGAFSKDRAPSSVMSARAFCKKYDCKKSRRVIIKYELDN